MQTGPLNRQANGPANNKTTERRVSEMTEQQTTPTSEILNRAADLIEEWGWKKGSGWASAEREAEGDTGLCLEGGIMAALGMRSESAGDEYHLLQELWTCPTYAAVADYLDRDVTLDERVNEPRQALYWWNDAQDSGERIVATLRAAALIEAAKENEAAPVEVSS